jgi:hypothetical protein
MLTVVTGAVAGTLGAACLAGLSQDYDAQRHEREDSLNEAEGQSCDALAEGAA